MDTKQILTLYDQDRKGVSLFGMQREETSHLVRHISPSGEGLIIYSNLNSTNVEEVIREQIAHFEYIGCNFSWVVYRHDTPANLRDHLLTHGFRAEDPDVIMVLDIEDVAPALFESIQYDVQRINRRPSQPGAICSIRR